MSLIASDQFRIVVGLGKSGMSLVRFLARQGLPFAVADSRANPPELATLRAEFPQVEVRCGELDVDFLCRANELLVSPGLALATPALQQAAARGVKLSGDIELFARNAKAPIIAFSADVRAGPLDPVFDGATPKPLTVMSLLSTLAQALEPPEPVTA